MRTVRQWSAFKEVILDINDQQRIPTGDCAAGLRGSQGNRGEEKKGGAHDVSRVNTEQHRKMPCSTSLQVILY